MSTTTKWTRGSPLPSKYWVENPNPGNATKEWQELWYKVSGGDTSTGYNRWYHIPAKGYTAQMHTPTTGEPCISWEDWRDTLNGVVQQGYKVGDWYVVTGDGSRVSGMSTVEYKNGTVVQVIETNAGSPHKQSIRIKSPSSSGTEVRGWDSPTFKSNLRPATEEEIAQATQSTEGWKVGQVLPVEWLKKTHVHTGKNGKQQSLKTYWCNDMKVSKVEADGWAKIGDTRAWLPPKHLCTPLPSESEEWVPKVGEWVVPIVDVDINSYALGSANRRKGKAYQVTGFVSNHSAGKYVTTKPDSEGCMLLTDLRAATPEEVRKAEGKPDKQYICTSEDGVKLYDKDEPFWVYNGNKGWVWKDKIALSSLHVMSTGSLTQTVKDGEPMWKVFSTKAAAEAWIEQQNNQQIPVTKENARVGMKVVRGKDWEYGDQDGGAGKVGVIQSERSYYPINEDYLWVRVKWEHGGSEAYRIGDKGKYHLYIAPGESSTNQTINNQSQKPKQNQTSYEKDSKQQQQDSSSICKGRNLRTKVEEHAGYQQARGESIVSIRKIKPKIVEGGY